MSTETATEGMTGSATKKTRTKKASKAATKKTSRVAKTSAKRAAGTKSANKERTGTKKAIVLELLRRKEGATLADIARATESQNHSIRGVISGTLTKKMGLRVESSKNDSGERTYRIA